MARWTYAYHFRNRRGNNAAIMLRDGRDGVPRTQSGPWLDLIEAVASAFRIPYLELLRNPNYDTVDALQRLTLTGHYYMPPGQNIPLNERRFRLPGNAARMRERALLCKMNGWISEGPLPGASRFDGLLDAHDLCAPSTPLKVLSDRAWPSPRKLIRARYGSELPDSDSEQPPHKRPRRFCDLAAASSSSSAFDSAPSHCHAEAPCAPAPWPPLPPVQAPPQADRDAGFLPRLADASPPSAFSTPSASGSFFTPAGPSSPAPQFFDPCPGPAAFACPFALPASCAWAGAPFAPDFRFYNPPAQLAGGYS
eukprot:tig00021073_g18065.t1